MLVVVLVIVARTLIGGDTHERREMGGLRRILLIFDEALHLSLHLGRILGGNLTQDDVGIRVVAGNFREVVVNLITADCRGGELRIVTHDNHEGEVVFVVIALNVAGLDL